MKRVWLRALVVVIAVALAAGAVFTGGRPDHRSLAAAEPAWSSVTAPARASNNAAPRANIAGTRERVSRAQTVSDRTVALLSTQISFRIGSFNVLGSWHSRPGRGSANYAPGPLRAHWAAEAVRAYEPGVVGLQEIELDQISVLAAELTNYSFYPGSSLGDKGVRNNIMWLASRFSLVQSGVMDEVFLGLRRYNPYVKLKDRATGRMFWVLNVHNSPNRGPGQTNEGERRTQVAHQVAKLNQLSQQGLPVFFTGDMNDKSYVHCQVVSKTNLRPPQGGGGSCTLPPNSHIEWVFGSRLSWSDYKYDRGPLLSRVSDHEITFATAKLN